MEKLPLEIWIMIGEYCLAPGLSLDKYTYDDIQRYKRHSKRPTVCSGNMLDFGGFVYLISEMYDERAVSTVITKCLNTPLNTSSGVVAGSLIFGADPLRIILIDMCKKRRSGGARCRCCMWVRPLCGEGSILAACWKAIMPPDDLVMCVDCLFSLYGSRFRSMTYTQQFFPSKNQKQLSNSQRQKLSSCYINTPYWMNEFPYGQQCALELNLLGRFLPLIDDRTLMCTVIGNDGVYETPVCDEMLRRGINCTQTLNELNVL